MRCDNEGSRPKKISVFVFCPGTFPRIKQFFVLRSGNFSAKLPILPLFGNSMVRYGLGNSYLQSLAVSNFNPLSHHIAASLPLPLLLAGGPKGGFIPEGTPFGSVPNWKHPYHS